MISPQLFDGKPHGFDRRRRDYLEKRIGNSLLDRRTTNIEAIHATPIGEVFASAVITRSCVPPTIMNVQTAPTMAARGDALQ